MLGFIIVGLGGAERGGCILHKSSTYCVLGSMLNIIIQQLFIVTCYVLGTVITVTHLFRVYLLNTDHAPGT